MSVATSYKYLCYGVIVCTVCSLVSRNSSIIKIRDSWTAIRFSLATATRHTRHTYPETAAILCILPASALSNNSDRNQNSMRLIDVHTLEITSFSDNNVPEYAILSHTWGATEVTYQEMSLITRMRSLSTTFDSQATETTQEANNSSVGAHPTFMLAAIELLVRGNWSPGSSLPDLSEEGLMKREGYGKIVYSARKAKELGYSWIWCDTCCIDKTSSSELQESINSMFRWYKDSAVCLVYLNDVQPINTDEVIFDTQVTHSAASNAFTKCRWASRGWTLQELVAPTSVRFYYQDWSLMGDKREFVEELSSATGIPIFVLENGDVSEISLAERMSWASERTTTRVEDIAYCLLGIFDIQMPLLYGEGEKAFVRLQEEILKTTDDYSLFAWRAAPSSFPSTSTTFSSASSSSPSSTYRGLLARSPLEFRRCGPIDRDNTTSVSPINSTSLGIRIQLEFLQDPTSKDKSRFLAMIRCSNHLNQRLAIYLKCLDTANQYARVDPSALVPIDNWPTGQLRTIYIRQKLSIPSDFYTPDIRCFRVQRRVADCSVPPLRITHAFPPEYWSQDNLELRIPESSKTFLGVLFVRAQSSSYGHSTTFQVIVGLDRETKHYWCKAAEFTWPALTADRGRWKALITRRLSPAVFDPLMKHDARNDLYIVENSEVAVNVGVRTGLWRDCVVLQVLIDGLVKG